VTNTPFCASLIDAKHCFATASSANAHRLASST
jgi:precorrin-6x reductase